MSDSVSPGVKDKVLFVDDEPHLLAAIQRGLRNQFEIHVATSGREALEILQQSGPFPLVVSDMRMPQMSGVQLLAQVRQRYPDTVRMIFSGQSDLPDTIAAVNEGNIFRFLSKPCGTGALLAAVQCGLQQYRLLSAEKVLLEQTLSGCAGMLVEILSMVMPAAHSRALRLQRYVAALATALGLQPQWQWPLAAVLSQIGCVSLPRETLARAEAGQPLNDEERALYDSHPQLARKLLEGIPRLEDVAAIVAAQMQVPGSPSITPATVSLQQCDARTVGAMLLRAAFEFDRYIIAGKSPTEAATAIRTAGVDLPDSVINALRTLPVAGQERVLRQVRLWDLAPGMLLDEALLTQKGACLVPAGHEVTQTLIVRLRSIAAGVKLREPFRVQVSV